MLSSRNFLASSPVEKRLSSSTPGYAGYMLARIGALRALGVTLSDYYGLLKRRAGTGRCRGQKLASTR